MSTRRDAFRILARASASEKNPTRTMLALSRRATDYLAAEMQRGNV